MRNTPGTDLLAGVIAVIRADSAEVATTLALGMEGTAVDAIEVTMTVPDAISVIRDLTGRLGVPLGVGTVTDPAMVEPAAAAGAEFIVGPGHQRDVVNAALEAGVPVVPGALTPTEILTAWEAGATAVKVFPVSSVGGPAYVEAVRAPLPHIPLIVSGGIRPDEVDAYRAAGALGVSLGSGLVDPATAATGDVEAVRRRIGERLPSPAR